MFASHRRSLRSVRLLAVAVVAMLVLGACGGGGDEGSADEGWAIVKVEVGEGQSSLSSICIADVCHDFGSLNNVRTGEFSVYASAGTEAKVRLSRMGPGEEIAAPAPIGGCLLVETNGTTTTFVEGCNAG